MTKAVFTYDTTTKKATGSELVSDDYVLKDGETFTELPTGISMPATFDGSTWQPATDSENEAYQKSIQPDNSGIVGTTGPTAEQKMINALGLQVASLQATVTKLTTTNGGAA